MTPGKLEQHQNNWRATHVTKTRTARKRACRPVSLVQRDMFRHLPAQCVRPACLANLKILPLAMCAKVVPSDFSRTWRRLSNGEHQDRGASLQKVFL